MPPVQFFSFSSTVSSYPSTSHFSLGHPKLFSYKYFKKLGLFQSLFGNYRNLVGPCYYVSLSAMQLSLLPQYLKCSLRIIGELMNKVWGQRFPAKIFLKIVHMSALQCTTLERLLKHTPLAVRKLVEIAHITIGLQNNLKK